jgi:hypothetical protein
VTENMHPNVDDQENKSKNVYFDFDLAEFPYMVFVI